MARRVKGSEENHSWLPASAPSPDGFLKNYCFIWVSQKHTGSPTTARPDKTVNSAETSLNRFFITTLSFRRRTLDALHHANIKWNMSHLSSLPLLQKKRKALCREHYLKHFFSKWGRKKLRNIELEDKKNKNPELIWPSRVFRIISSLFFLLPCSFFKATSYYKNFLKKNRN